MKLVYSGFDTLDIAFQGALGVTELETLEAARQKARKENADQLVAIGSAHEVFLLKQHGQSGGYAYTLTNGDTGAIFSFKHSNCTTDWNIFVSVRAACLLTRGYTRTKEWVSATLAGMGARVITHSVNRIDIAFDIHAPDFKLDAQRFIYPSRATQSTCCKPAHHLDDEGNKFSAVLSGAAFQSVTIGKMPGRQLIVYNKTQAALDKRQPYWFEVWGLNGKSKDSAVWRVEVRAGRGALEQLLTKRTYDFVDAMLPQYVDKTLQDIRYVSSRDEVTNVHRAKLDPLWKLAKDEAKVALEHRPPPILQDRIIAIMREQRAKMAMDQVTGCAIRAAALRGHSQGDIESDLPEFVRAALKADLSEKGQAWIEKKTRNTFDSLSLFLTPKKQTKDYH